MGNQTRALQLIDGCQSRGRADVFAEYCQILGLLLRGETRQAVILLNAMAIERQGEDLMDGEMDYKVAQLLSVAGELSLANDAAALAWQRGFRCQPCYATDPLFSNLRNDPDNATLFSQIYLSDNEE